MAYINQAPREFAKQSASFKKANPTLEGLHPSEYTMQPKYDGCHLIIHLSDEGVPRAFSRTGEPVRSVDHIIAQALHVYGRGWVLFGEAYDFGLTFPEISGNFRQHRPAENLCFMAFDAVPASTFDLGLYYPTPYRERLAALRAAVNGAGQSAPDIIVTPDLPLDNPAGFALRLKKQGGYDGAIVRCSNAGWQAGDSKHGEVIKVKPVESLDLRVRGWFLGKGKHDNRAGGIYVEYNGVQPGVGTGFTDDERSIIAQGTRDGAIAEVEFMGFTEDGALREPRFKGWRYDKLKAD
jgi:DNA ligase-1